ncbi:hypothetical protein LIA77_09460 [Sarocladium implicatum]|nr:hypothetical protein LIA77_09460 [Sarocladium implicatum]
MGNAPFRGEGLKLRDDYLGSYTSLGAYSLPPNKPLPALPSSRYSPFPRAPTARYTSHSQPSPVSSPAATASILSVSDLSTCLDGSPSWELDSETVSRPDSCTLPPTPGIRQDSHYYDEEHDNIFHGGFVAVEQHNGFVRFWVRTEDALLEDRMVERGVAHGEARRLAAMAREVVLLNRRGGPVEYVQLLMGTYRELERRDGQDG